MRSKSTGALASLHLIRWRLFARPLEKAAPEGDMEFINSPCAGQTAKASSTSSHTALGQGIAKLEAGASGEDLITL